MNIDVKRTVAELMKMAVEFRLAPAQNYDAAYKQLQNALYQVVESEASGTGGIGDD